MTTASFAETDFFEELRDTIGLASGRGRETLEGTPRRRPLMIELQGGNLLVKGEGEPPKWFLPVVQSIGGMQSLRSNWNSYGARPVNPHSVVAALQFLVRCMSVDSKAPQVVPAVDGNIVLEWHNGGFDLEVKVGPRGPVHYYFESPDGREVEQDLGEELQNFEDLVSTVRRCA